MTQDEKDMWTALALMLFGIMISAWILRAVP